MKSTHLCYVYVFLLITLIGQPFSLNAQSTTSVPLGIRIENNNLYINSCNTNLTPGIGYKGYVDGVEIFSTGGYGGFPCYSGDLFINNLTSFYSANTTQPFVSSFDFYQNSSFSSPVTRSFHVNFDGTSFSLPNNLSGNSSVLFIPGLQASRLYEGTVLNCTLNCEDQLWEPNANSDVEDLYLDESGNSIRSNIYTRDIILETNTPTPSSFVGQNIYKNFADNMNQLVANEDIKEWKAFPYDWRKSVDDIVNTEQSIGNNETVFLQNVLESLVASSSNGKVTIISHSNGGLIAKAFLQKLKDDKQAGRNNLIDSVDVLILVAVPEIGTAKAIPAVLHGYDSQMLLGWLMDEVRARELGRNMPGGYGLLPSQQYINHVSASPIIFTDSGIYSNVTTAMVSRYGSSINLYSEYKDFLFGFEGRTNPGISQTYLPINLSQGLFREAEDLHGVIDNFIPPSSLRVIEVAGWGLDTVASFEYYPRTVGCSGQGAGCISYLLDQRPRFTVDGDKTVVVPSAHYMNFQGNAERYWVNLEEHNASLVLLRRNREHKDIFEVNQVNNFITSVIKKEDLVFDTVLKDTMPVDTKNRFRLSVHSPVTLSAYDINGNHTGKVCPTDSDFCYVEEQIVNSSYLEFGEGKYINLPEEELAVVRLQGTGIGTFTYESEKVLPGNISTTTSFINIPVTTQTQVEIVSSTTAGVLELKLDITGDGVTDFILYPSNEFDPVIYLQIIKETINSLDLPQGKKIVFSKRVDNIIKSIEKGKIDKAKLRADKFKAVLEKKITKPDPKNNKPKKVSKTDAQLLLDMLNNLLDNLV